MPNPKNSRQGGHEKNCRKGLSSEKASSFHGRTGRVVEEGMLPRPRTLLDLVARKRVGAGAPDVVAMQERRELTKLLLNVTIKRSLGAVQGMTPPDATVEDLIAAVLRQHAKEGRRLILPSTDPNGFDLHYSQFSLESKLSCNFHDSANYFLIIKKITCFLESKKKIIQTVNIKLLFFKGFQTCLLKLMSISHFQSCLLYNIFDNMSRVTLLLNDLKNNISFHPTPFCHLPTWSTML